MILADEELREVAPKSTGIEIQEFVNEAEISSLYFEKPYYLEPDKGVQARLLLFYGKRY